MIGPNSRLKRRDDILAQRASETQLLLNLSSGQYYALDEVGTRIWELCDGSRTVAEIAAVVGDEYDAPIDVIQADALELLEDLAGENLVVEAR